MTIKINLLDLTEAHLKEALPHLGACHYASPCIIGTLIPVEHRERLDNHGEFGSPMINQLVKEGVVEFADERQARIAANMQTRFDNPGDFSKKFSDYFRGVLKRLAK